MLYTTTSASKSKKPLISTVRVHTITTNDLLIGVRHWSMFQETRTLFLRLHTFDLVWSKQQVLIGNRRLISDQLAVSSKSSLMWYRLYVLVSCLMFVTNQMCLLLKRLWFVGVVYTLASPQEQCRGTKIYTIEYYLAFLLLKYLPQVLH